MDDRTMQRVNRLKIMHRTISCMDDERAYDVWAAHGVPDGADEEDYNEIANDVEEYYRILYLYFDILEKYDGQHSRTDGPNAVTKGDCEMLSKNFKRNAKLVLGMAMELESDSVFVEFSPHTKQLRVYGYTGGWKPDTNSDVTLTVYDGRDFGNSFDEIFDTIDGLK